MGEYHNGTIDETRKHIHKVQYIMYHIIQNLKERAENHDKSKLEEPERSGFEAMDAELTAFPIKYGSPEYYEKLNRYKDILNHHYANNSHHPEHYQGFISEMDLLDITEMLCDWWSRKDEHSPLSAIIMIESQTQRFGITDPLKSILLNTVKRYMAN